MNLEFRTKDRQFNGPDNWLRGQIVGPVTILTEDLPYGTQSEHLKPFILESLKKYAVEVTIKSHKQFLELETLGNPRFMCQISHDSYAEMGLRARMVYGNGNVEGTFYPTRNSQSSG